jgi:hypothetical protein
MEHTALLHSPSTFVRSARLVPVLTSRGAPPPCTNSVADWVPPVPPRTGPLLPSSMRPYAPLLIMGLLRFGLGLGGLDRSRPLAILSLRGKGVGCCGRSTRPAAFVLGGGWGSRTRPRTTSTRVRAKGKGSEESTEESLYRDTVCLPKTAFDQRANAPVREPQIQNFWEEQAIYKQLSKGNPGKEGAGVAAGELFIRMLVLRRPRFCIARWAPICQWGPAYRSCLEQDPEGLHQQVGPILWLLQARGKLEEECQMPDRYHMLRGYKVKYVPGWDCHGLPIELKVLQGMKQSERENLTPLGLR